MTKKKFKPYWLGVRYANDPKDPFTRSGRTIDAGGYPLAEVKRRLAAIKGARTGDQFVYKIVSKRPIV